MTTYAIGDLQGCGDALQRLLETIQFDPTIDRLWLVGDLVNRGPSSLATLRFLRELGDAAVCILGNHDIHLLGVVAGVRKLSKTDTLDAILAAPDRDDLIDWLRARPLAHQQPIGSTPYLMVHAGVLPQWSVDDTLQYAGELQLALSGPDWKEFMGDVFGNEPARWDDRLTGVARLRVIVNALTRLRLCDAAGTMDLKSKEGPDQAPGGYMPWFDVPGRRTAQIRMVTGHWSTLGLLERTNLLALDTGCVWGGKLTAVALETGRTIQVKCPQYQFPG